MEKVTLESIDVNELDEQKCRELGLDYAVVRDNPQQVRYGALIGVICLHLQDDEAFSKAMLQSSTAEERYELCKKYLDVPFADFQAAHDLLLERLDDAMYEDKATGRLSDEALDLVAGGSKAGANKFFGNVGRFFKGFGVGLGGLATMGAGAVASVFDKEAGAKVLSTGVKLTCDGGRDLAGAITGQ